MFQIVAQEKFKRIKKLEGLVEEWQGVARDKQKEVKLELLKAEREKERQSQMSGGKYKKKMLYGDDEDDEYGHVQSFGDGGGVETGDIVETTDIDPDISIAECLEDAQFTADPETRAAIRAAQAEMRENDLEQKRRHEQTVYYGTLTTHARTRTCMALHTRTYTAHTLAHCHRHGHHGQERA